LSRDDGNFALFAGPPTYSSSKTTSDRDRDVPVPAAVNTAAAPAVETGLPGMEKEMRARRANAERRLANQEREQAAANVPGLEREMRARRAAAERKRANEEREQSQRPSGQGL